MRICIEETYISYQSYIFLTNYNLHRIDLIIIVLLSPEVCSVHNLFAMLSSPTPADQSLYYHIDYPTGMYSTFVRGNSLDVLLRSVLAIERVHRRKIVLCTLP